MKDPNNDHVDELLTELECLKEELEVNQSEQTELRSQARSLFKDIEAIEKELNNLGIDYD